MIKVSSSFACLIDSNRLFKEISEEAVLKIKKALALAGHKTTGEQEARAALRYVSLCCVDHISNTNKICRGVAKLLRKYK